MQKVAVTPTTEGMRMPDLHRLEGLYFRVAGASEGFKSAFLINLITWRSEVKCCLCLPGK